MAEIDRDKEQAFKFLSVMFVVGLVAGPVIVAWAVLNHDWRYIVVGSLLTLHTLWLRWVVTRSRAKALAAKD